MTRYDPLKHHRRSIRLKDFDYRQPGAYFVTLLTKNRELLFGDVIDGVMQKNTYGRIVDTFWRRLPEYFSQVALDESMVMPNHVHGIIWITELDESTGEREKVFAHMGRFQSIVSPDIPKHPRGPIPGSLGAFMANFQIATARRINKVRNSRGESVWHRDFYDEIIRNQRHLDAVRQYIRNNPKNWDLDPDKPTP